MNSCLYQGSVFHRRTKPRLHEFTYPVFLFLLDLDELPELPRFSPLLQFNRAGLYSFHNSDHWGKQSPAPLRPRLEAFLQEHGMPSADRVLYLCNLRFCGYVFNPIAVYFCYGTDGSLFAAVAQVGNTFGEQKLYLVPASATASDSPALARARLPKNFYVSPFSPPDLEFEFRLHAPTETLRVYVDDWQGDEKILVSALTGKRRPLTTGQLLAATLRFPFITLRVIFLIHWQAFRLWLKKIPHCRKEQNPEKQTNILNPK
jgi:DUF1365 family protein